MLQRTARLLLLLTDFQPFKMLTKSLLFKTEGLVKWEHIKNYFPDAVCITVSTLPKTVLDI